MNKEIVTGKPLCRDEKAGAGHLAAKPKLQSANHGGAQPGR